MLFGLPSIIDLSNMINGQHDDIDSIEEFSETERRLLRHNNIYNNDSEQEDNSNINENDIEIDFRIYPLNINWCNIYIQRKMIHVNISQLILDVILEEYGYITVYIYNIIWEKIKTFKSIPIILSINLWNYFILH